MLHLQVAGYLLRGLLVGRMYCLRLWCPPWSTHVEPRLTINWVSFFEPTNGGFPKWRAEHDSHLILGSLSQEHSPLGLTPDITCNFLFRLFQVKYCLFLSFVYLRTIVEQKISSIAVFQVGRFLPLSSPSSSSVSFLPNLKEKASAFM